MIKMELEQYKSSAFEIFDRLLRAMRSPEGYVHPQSLLCCIGSLAGYSCQQDVRKLFMTEGVKEEDVFTVFTDKLGRKYSTVISLTKSLWAITTQCGLLPQECFKNITRPFTDVGGNAPLHCGKRRGRKLWQNKKLYHRRNCPKLYKASLATASAYSAEVSRQGRASHSFRTLHTKSHDDLQKRSFTFRMCKDSNGECSYGGKGGLQGLVR